MLTRLQVRNYVLIDSLEIDFPEGLIIITGQTGAGKSILLGALSLLMGSKADMSMVSEGADNCVVEAEFSLANDYLKELLNENDIEGADDDYLIIRRVVNRSGRSRAFVNDCPVSVQLLQDLSSHLIDIHSQHQTLLLTDRKYQLDLLDFFASNTALREDCAAYWRQIQSLKNELADLEAKIAKVSGEKDYNEAQFRQLEAAALRSGELAELEEEQRQLANAEEIKTNLGAIAEILDSSSDELMPMDASLKEATRLLNRLSKYLPKADELSERLDSCRREIADVLAEVSDINERTDISEARLEEVENRMSLIYMLLQKHSCSEVEELILLRDRLSEELFDSSQLEYLREELLNKIEKLSSAHKSVSDELHRRRVEMSVSFANDIQNSIRSLELPYAIFELELKDELLSASGYDAVIFKFSASGKNAQDVAKCASGGEMSRIMLVLKQMRARYANMPTMIFDEIDTGVSGSVADKMGSMICDMGKNMQVFAITHLPQVAAKGEAHYLVSKEIDPITSTAVSKINRLSDEQRVYELARMLSGSSLTDAAIANAKSLLSI